MCIRRKCVAVVLAGQGRLSSCVEAIRLGACDYLTKPFTPARVRQSLARALECCRNRCCPPTAGEECRAVPAASVAEADTAVIAQGPAMAAVMGPLWPRSPPPMSRSSFAAKRARGRNTSWPTRFTGKADTGRPAPGEYAQMQRDTPRHNSKPGSSATGSNKAEEDMTDQPVGLLESARARHPLSLRTSSACRSEAQVRLVRRLSPGRVSDHFSRPPVCVVRRAADRFHFPAIWKPPWPRAVSTAALLSLFVTAVRVPPLRKATARHQISWWTLLAACVRRGTQRRGEEPPGASPTRRGSVC